MWENEEIVIVKMDWVRKWNRWFNDDIYLVVKFWNFNGKVVRVVRNSVVLKDVVEGRIFLMRLESCVRKWLFVKVGSFVVWVDGDSFVNGVVWVGVLCVGGKSNDRNKVCVWFIDVFILVRCGCCGRKIGFGIVVLDNVFDVVRVDELCVGLLVVWMYLVVIDRLIECYK